ncbi:CheY-like chemotaxis protein [Spirosoma lacussanchae]|uniref:hypothetical protein n=1 Tax=Spirosoma lacussanchae TaxID=1884249 RepID=UPI001FE2A6F9|nr:hypothetical protein [Spirosoma lacussanchae]
MAPVSVVAVMTGDALLLTRQRIEALGIHCQLQAVEWGAELANVLLTHPADEWPSLILLDGRENRPDRMLTLQRLKSDYRLRAIPAVWLASPGDNPIPAYELDVNSVIEVANTPTSFVETIDQLCQYWLMLVQLPQETDAQAV